jgi:hypothetical protein
MYRRQWPRIGAAAAAIVAGGTALAGGRLVKRQRLAALNLSALMVHQYEEYCDPGYFPGQFNRGLWKSDSPRNYLLNTNAAMWINTAIAYPLYVAPILLPEKKWVGLGPVLFGIGQAAFHGMVFPRLGRCEGRAYTYSPGLLAAGLLHLPIGVAYIRALREDGPIGKDWRKGIAYAVAINWLGIGVPILMLRDRESPHAFTNAQMGPYAGTTSE